VPLALHKLDDAVELGVRVAPGARRSQLVGIYGDRLKVAVKAPPDRGRANKELVQLLATALELRSEQVEVVRGHTSRDKTVRLSGASGGELERRLLALVETIQA
jgi:uncharacterized protein (TIGR00251 family)